MMYVFLYVDIQEHRKPRRSRMHWSKWLFAFSHKRMWHHQLYLGHGVGAASRHCSPERCRQLVFLKLRGRQQAGYNPVWAGVQHLFLERTKKKTVTHVWGTGWRTDEFGGKVFSSVSLHFYFMPTNTLWAPNCQTVDHAWLACSGVSVSRSSCVWPALHLSLESPPLSIVY